MNPALRAQMEAMLTTFGYSAVIAAAGQLSREWEEAARKRIFAFHAEGNLEGILAEEQALLARKS